MGHTPGPWREDPTDIDPGGGKFDTRYYGYTRIRGEDNDLVVGDIDVSTPEGEANLRLIASAPDLLTAIKDLLYELPRNSGGLQAKRIEAARDAIEKATGQQQNEGKE